jgi:hypothetical protein
MQFSYQNVEIEDENIPDIRTYGLLNKNLVDDEQDYNKYMIGILEKRLKSAEEKNLALEEINKKYLNNINTLTQSLKMFVNEYDNKIKELENMINKN